jgi:hypothetical protein
MKFWRCHILVSNTVVDSNWSKSTHGSFEKGCVTYFLPCCDLNNNKRKHDQRELGTLNLN